LASAKGASKQAGRVAQNGQQNGHLAARLAASPSLDAYGDVQPAGGTLVCEAQVQSETEMERRQQHLDGAAWSLGPNRLAAQPRRQPSEAHKLHQVARWKRAK